jgi:hypothetical protein
MRTLSPQILPSNKNRLIAIIATPDIYIRCFLSLLFILSQSEVQLRILRMKTILRVYNSGILEGAMASERGVS